MIHQTEGVAAFDHRDHLGVIEQSMELGVASQLADSGPNFAKNVAHGGAKEIRCFGRVLIDQSDGSHLAAEFLVFGKTGEASGVERRSDRTGLDVRPEVRVLLDGEASTFAQKYVSCWTARIRGFETTDWRSTTVAPGLAASLATTCPERPESASTDSTPASTTDDVTAAAAELPNAGIPSAAPERRRASTQSAR